MEADMRLKSSPCCESNSRKRAKKRFKIGTSKKEEIGWYVFKKDVGFTI
jgi:hypothetical protein